MVEFNGAGVVAVALPTSVVEFVPVPSSPDMVVWALPGPVGDIPYADVEALVDLEFDDRIGQMETLQQSAQTSRNQALSYRNTASDHATAAAGSASTASTKAGDAATSASQALAYRNTASTHASTATTKATEASNSATTATTKANAAAASAADAEQWANSFGLTVGSTNTTAPGSSASVTMAGSGPEYALSFSIPEGVKGDKGDKGDKGAAGGQEVAWTPDGRPYLLDSPDVSGGDSGWRTIDTKNNSGGNPNRLDLRRIGGTCYARVYGQPGWANNETITFVGVPAGFKHELGRFHDNTYGCSAPIITNIGNGQPTDCGRIGYRLWVNQEIQVRITNNGTRYWVAELSWLTSDEWPETLPGTAAE